MKNLLFTLMICLGLSVNAQDYKITKVLDNGPAETTYNLVVVAEAYTSNDMQLFEDAAAAMESAYRQNDHFNNGLIDKMNIYAISCPSVDNEISLIANNPGPTDAIQVSQLKTTQFGIHYLNTYRAYLIPDTTLIKARRMAAEHVPFVDNVVIMVNASQPGQRLSGRASIEDAVSVIGVANNFSSSWEKYILIHETGHSMGGLSDAYSTTAEEGFNKTINRDPSTIRWKSFLNDPDVSIDSITPGVYIPNRNCLMRSTNPAFFCPVCAHVMTQTIGTDEVLKIPNVHRVEVVSEDLTADIFTFKWDAVPGATAYEVIYTNSAYVQGVYEKKILTQTTTTNQVTFDLKGEYYVSFRDKITVRAYNDNFSTFFQPFDVQIPVYWKPSVPFNVPSNITTSEVTSTSVKLSWNDTRNSQATEIRLWNANGEFSELRTENNSISLHNLEKDATYFVQVAAIEPIDLDSNNASPFSEKMEVKLAGVTSILKLASNSSKLNIYPNPAANTFEIQYLQSSTDFEIINESGKVVKKGVITPGKQIEINELAAGSYFVVTKQNNTALKFIKL
jgi:hypothetical protein